MKQKKLLIVDKNGNNLKELTKIIKNTENVIYFCQPFYLLEDFVKDIQQSIGVVLLPIFEEEKNDLSQIKKACEVFKKMNLPILAVLEKRDLDLEGKIIKYGFEDIIGLPYSPKVVNKRIEDVIENYINKNNRSKSNEEWYQIIVELSGMLVLEWNIENHTFYCSEGFKNLVMGYLDSWDLLASRGIVKAVHKDDILILKRDFFEKINLGKTVKALVRLKKISGSYVWCELSAMSLKDETGKISKVISIINLVEEDISARQKLKEKSEIDLLTGVYSKKSFYQKTHEMLLENPGRKYLILCLDIERFHMINDLFGIGEGDRLLSYMGKQLKLRIPKEYGTVGRLSVDVFAIAVPDAGVDAQTLVNEFGELLKNYELEFDINIALGIYYIEDRKIPIHFMCDRAIMALKTVKGNYLKHCAVYDDTLRRAMLEEQDILNDMEYALKNNQFKVFYQPVYNLNTGKITSAEALVRWEHPRKGMLLPDSFVPLFEHNGFITKLDIHVWEDVCEKLHYWKKKGYRVLPVSINVSRVHLYDSNFIFTILNLIKKYDISPNLLKLEMTESAYTENEKQLQLFIEQLQKNGFKILMDDFGSGYSSLNMLKDIPVDVIKIDMRFLSDLQNSYRAGSILISVVQMAKRLKLHVVAEGVETLEQVEYLRGIGCESAQGYFLSKPLPIGDYEMMMVRNEIAVWFKEDIKKMKGYQELETFLKEESTFANFWGEFIGGIGIVEMKDSKELALVRGNDKLFEILEISREMYVVNKEYIFNNLNKNEVEKFIDKCILALESGEIQEIIYRTVNKKVPKKLHIKIRCVGGDINLSTFFIIVSDISCLLEGSNN